MEIIQDSQSKQLDLESIGIKGAALRHLRSLRFYVPKFTIFTSAFFESIAEASGFSQKAQFALENISDHEELAREFQRLLSELHIPQSLNAKLDDALRDLAGQGSLRVVARPSRPYMSKVDSAHHLNLTSKADLVDALSSIYQEHFTKVAIEERLDKGLPAVHLKLPIIVQVFVKPDVTGLVFPYRDEQGFFYIAAWKGFGFELDFHKADHYLVNYKDLMLEKFLNNTSGDVIFFEEESGSITRTKILHEEAEKAFLDHDQIIEMCKLYAENASELGGLAIEFKIHGEDVSFISLKDAALLDKAESALEDLRSAPPASSEPEEASIAPTGEAPTHEPSASEALASNVASEGPATPPEAAAPIEPETRVEPEALLSDAPSAEPTVDAEAPTPDQPLSEPDTPAQEPQPSGSYRDADAREHAVPELSHSSDRHVIVSKLIDKYVAINPDLEKQFRLLEQDLLDALR